MLKFDSDGIADTAAGPKFSIFEADSFIDARVLAQKNLVGDAIELDGVICHNIRQRDSGSSRPRFLAVKDGPKYYTQKEQHEQHSETPRTSECSC